MSNVIKYIEDMFIPETLETLSYSIYNQRIALNIIQPFYKVEFYHKILVIK